MVNYEKDAQWGMQQENKVFRILKKKWKFIKPTERWAKYDFVSKYINIEMKSRKNSYNKYPTTLLTCNKIKEEENKKIYFVFNFVYDMRRDLSEIYYIRYREDKFSKYEKKMFSRAKESWDEKEYYYIPIEDLKFLYREEPPVIKEVSRIPGNKLNI